MRLSEIEKKAILEGLRITYPNLKYEVYLYGSRTHDDLKGGDIDLCVIVSDPTHARSMLPLRARALVNIEKLLPPQKIDLSIIDEADRRTNPFWLRALEGSAQLK